MRIRIRFTKNDSVKYLGHLDIMRAFQKCMNRADVKMQYSEGFNPHQKMSFALPLGVGITSTAEYLDAQIADGQDLSEIRKNLQDVSGPGFDILYVGALKETAVKAMAAVRYADFEVSSDNGKEDALLFTQENVDRFLQQEHIICTKKTKKGEREEDIRPMIISMQAQTGVLKLCLCAGSENNLKAETLLTAFYSFCGKSYDREGLEIVRTELRGEDHIPLQELDCA